MQLTLDDCKDTLVFGDKAGGRVDPVVNSVGV